MSKFITVRYSIRVPSRFVQNGGGKTRSGRDFVRIVFLSDLHDYSFGRNNRALKGAVEKAEPDLIVSAGDLVTAKAGRIRIENSLKLVSYLARRYPFYFVDGNHELRMKDHPETYGDSYKNLNHLLESFGGIAVNNSHSRPENLPLALDICGYAPVHSRYRRVARIEPTAEDLEKALGTKPKDRYTVLLAHHPDFFPAYAQWGADLTLSGHLHGGIVRLPALGGVIGSSLRLFPKYDLGEFAIENRKMIVSAGLGSHTVRLRINDPMQLVLIDLMYQSGSGSGAS